MRDLEEIRDSFELEKDICEWLVNEGNLSFNQAMSLINYAEHTDRTIAKAYFDLMINNFSNVKEPCNQQPQK